MVICTNIEILMRILVIAGSRVDDLEYMNEHNIDPKQVSAELTRIFSEMIFLHGFVHCDPRKYTYLLYCTYTNACTYLALFRSRKCIY